MNIRIGLVHLCSKAKVAFKLYAPTLPPLENLIRLGQRYYLQLSFEIKMVVEKNPGTVLAAGRLRSYARTALKRLSHLAGEPTPPLINVPRMNRFGTSRSEEDGVADVQGRETGPYSLGGAVTSAAPTSSNPLLNKVSECLKLHIDRNGGWEDDTVYGGLAAVRDIPQLGTHLLEVSFLATLAKAMKENKPLHVRKAAYDVIQAAQDGWLRSANLRQALKDHDLLRRLHSVVLETGRSDNQLSFLKMMEILSEDRYYLREAMNLWLDFRHAGPHQVITILLRVGEIRREPQDVRRRISVDRTIRVHQKRSAVLAVMNYGSSRLWRSRNVIDSAMFQGRHLEAQQRSIYCWRWDCRATG